MATRTQSPSYGHGGAPAKPTEGSPGRKSIMPGSQNLQGEAWVNTRIDRAKSDHYPLEVHLQTQSPSIAQVFPARWTLKGWEPNDEKAEQAFREDAAEGLHKAAPLNVFQAQDVILQAATGVPYSTSALRMWSNKVKASEEERAAKHAIRGAEDPAQRKVKKKAYFRMRSTRVKAEKNARVSKLKLSQSDDWKPGPQEWKLKDGTYTVDREVWRGSIGEGQGERYMDFTNGAEVQQEAQDRLEGRAREERFRLGPGPY